MKRRLTQTLSLAFALTLTAPLPCAAAVAGASSHASTVTTVTLDVRHRVFQNFAARYQVRLNQEFIIGDTDFSARVVQYVPDFAMEYKTRKVVSRSAEPNNPAFRIIVREKKVPQDTTWALLHMPPHFARKSMLAFQVERIDFYGREPLIRADSVAVKPAMPTKPVSEAEAAPTPKHAASTKPAERTAR
jgi:hypothetical protein